MRICSLLPASTEILLALGLGDQLVGVSHECVLPPEGDAIPRVIRTAIDQAHAGSRTIDDAVRSSLAGGASLYTVDQAALEAARPDVIITQSLCKVCAVKAPDVIAASRALTPKPEIITLHPHSLEDIFRDIRLLGHATHRNAQARQLVNACLERMDRVRRRVAGQPPVSVACIEWLAPLMACGHWVPEQVACAGGRELLGRAGGASRYITWDELIRAQPEALILMPCGFPIERTRREMALLTVHPAWSQLPAVRQERVHLVDGPAYFNCSGPRVVDGIELLAELLHPRYNSGSLAEEDSCAGTA